MDIIIIILVFLMSAGIACLIIGLLNLIAEFFDD